MYLLIPHTIFLEYIYCAYLNGGDTVAYIRQCYRKQTNGSRFQLKQQRVHLHGPYVKIYVNIIKDLQAIWDYSREMLQPS